MFGEEVSEEGGEGECGFEKEGKVSVDLKRRLRSGRRSECVCVYFCMLE